MQTYLSPKQVATKLNVDVKTVYRLIDRGLIKAVKVGSNIRIAEGAVQSWLDRNSL